MKSSDPGNHSSSQLTDHVVKINKALDAAAWGPEDDQSCVKLLHCLIDETR